MLKPYSGTVIKDQFVEIGFFKQEEAALKKTALDYILMSFLIVQMVRFMVC